MVTQQLIDRIRSRLSVVQEQVLLIAVTGRTPVVRARGPIDHIVTQRQACFGAPDGLSATHSVQRCQRIPRVVVVPFPCQVNVGPTTRVGVGCT